MRQRFLGVIFKKFQINIVDKKRVIFSFMIYQRILNLHIINFRTYENGQTCIIMDRILWRQFDTFVSIMKKVMQISIRDHWIYVTFQIIPISRFILNMSNTTVATNGA